MQVVLGTFSQENGLVGAFFISENSTFAKVTFQIPALLAAAASSWLAFH